MINIRVDTGKIIIVLFFLCFLYRSRQIIFDRKQLGTVTRPFFKKQKSTATYEHQKPSREFTEKNEAFNRKWLSENGLKPPPVVTPKEFNMADPKDGHSNQLAYLLNIKRGVAVAKERLGLAKLKQYRFVDVGCGSGISTIFGAASGLFANNSLGFDYSQDFVEQSKLNYQRYQNVKGHEEGNNIEFFQGGIASDRYDNDVFASFGLVIEMRGLLNLTAKFLCFCLILSGEIHWKGLLITILRVSRNKNRSWYTRMIMNLIYLNRKSITALKLFEKTIICPSSSFSVYCLLLVAPNAKFLLGSYTLRYISSKTL